MDSAIVEPGRTQEDVSIVRPRLKLSYRALRVGRAHLPWLSTVKLPWGLEVRLLNISTSGMLVETTSKFTPGSVAEFELCGTDDAFVVPGRFVRSEIIAVDGRGVRYRAAAVFEKEVDLDGPHPTLARVASTPQGFAEWLLQMSTGLDRGLDADALRDRIEHGLCRLVSARSVQILAEPIAPPDGCESIYFRTAGAGGHRAVLQVTFEPGYAPSELDFRMLQAGAALATVVLQLGGS